MELKNSRSSGRAGLEPSELKSKLKVELDALSQNMLKIRPETKCSRRKNGIKKFPESPARPELREFFNSIFPGGAFRLGPNF